jgi:hypothetical protein
MSLGQKQALEVLERELKQIREENRLEEQSLEETINALRRNMEKTEQSKKKRRDLTVKKGGWVGMAAPDAIHAYLAQADGPVSFLALVDALITGGVDLGTDPKRYERNVRSTLGNTRDRFLYDPEKEMVDLLPSSGLLKRAKAKREAKTKARKAEKKAHKEATA